MKLSDFQYELPEALIAQQPLPERSASRMLHMARATGALHDRAFAELPALLNENDLLVTNNTRVIPARLFAEKPTGGKVEILLERMLESAPSGEDACLAQLRCSKRPQPGMVLAIDGVADAGLTVVGREGSFWRLQAPAGKLAGWLERFGHMPLPPYIQREDSAADRERYQTVFSALPGAVAAPTAGLHFDQATLDALQDKGVRRAEVTLHVGAGTFQPVRTDRLEEHRMHSEWYHVPETVVGAVAETRERGGRVIAVGTTSVRSLESAAAANDGTLAPTSGESRLFIYPPYDFRVVDGLLTNFHLPESTLLMLVSAFAGHAETLAAYRHAVEERYRFFSYGDAMLIL